MTSSGLVLNISGNGANQDLGVLACLYLFLGGPKLDGSGFHPRTAGSFVISLRSISYDRIRLTG